MKRDKFNQLENYHNYTTFTLQLKIENSGFQRNICIRKKIWVLNERELDY